MMRAGLVVVLAFVVAVYALAAVIDGDGTSLCERWERGEVVPPGVQAVCLRQRHLAAW